MVAFSHAARKVSPTAIKRVSAINLRICVTDCTGDFYITDMMLQGGAVATGWIGHVCELKWTHDG